MPLKTHQAKPPRSGILNGFCQIDGDGRILHGGLLLMFGFLRTVRDHFVIASDQEESISSLQRSSRAQR
jgi:hypothetical protein